MARSSWRCVIPIFFRSATSHSGALAFGHRPQPGNTALSVELQRITGTNPAGGGNDLYALADKIEDPANLPALRIDCGTEDFLIEDNRSFHAHLVRRKLEHEYKEFPGGHEWGYWDTHVQEAIAFHRQHLGI